MLVLAQQDSVISEQLAEDLADVETRFAAELQSDLECVNDLASHIERYRGKMLRPTLVLVSALACLAEGSLDQAGEVGDTIEAGQKTSENEGVAENAASEAVDVISVTGDAHRVIATVAEMVHMATLVHDDILDEAEIRRKGKTINNLTTNETAVMLGDYLISHAYHLCSSLPDEKLARMIAFATNTVCEGELYQLHNRGNFELTEKTYFEIIRRKTASLCGMCCKIAAYLSKASEEKTDALYAYGEKLGIAFQIVDDVLDLTGVEETVGKSLGRDLEKSKLTLPLIHYRDHASAEDREAMLELLQTQAKADLDPEIRETQVKAIAVALRDHGSVEYARETAAGLIGEAKQLLLDHLIDSPARNLLLAMADAVISREF